MEIFPLFDNDTGKDWEPWLYANVFLVLVVAIVAIFGMKKKRE